LLTFLLEEGFGYVWVVMKGSHEIEFLDYYFTLTPTVIASHGYLRFPASLSFWFFHETRIASSQAFNGLGSC